MATLFIRKVIKHHIDAHKTLHYKPCGLDS